MLLYCAACYGVEIHGCTHMQAAQGDLDQLLRRIEGRRLDAETQREADLVLENVKPRLNGAGSFGIWLLFAFQLLQFALLIHVREQLIELRTLTQTRHEESQRP